MKTKRKLLPKCHVVTGVGQTGIVDIGGSCSNGSQQVDSIGIGMYGVSRDVADVNANVCSTHAVSKRKRVDGHINDVGLYSLGSSLSNVVGDSGKRNGSLSGQMEHLVEMVPADRLLISVAIWIAQVHRQSINILEVLSTVASTMVPIFGQLYHWIGAFCPAEGEPPRFIQLYIYDMENEVDNRIHHFSGENSGLCRDIVEGAHEYELPTSDMLGAIVYEDGPEK
ncbi:hypothetical protein Tco_0248129 [Tanacetum coccineum]